MRADRRGRIDCRASLEWEVGCLNESRPRTLAQAEAHVEGLRRSLGGEHPETLAAMLELAEMLWARGRLAEVRAIEEHVVAVRRRTLGDAHGDTLKALGKLAATTGAQGDL
ncbi:MAG TPA: tetratricopeptide repeat protein, partial [Stellaceae bacterium]|nr:tetratricopeptide repeat protein [Stellaceae bacterium]